MYTHAEQHGHMHACVNTCRYIQPDVKALITARLTMIDHDDQNPSSMHACKGMFVYGWLLTHKQRCTSMQTSMHTSMHV